MSQGTKQIRAGRIMEVIKTLEMLRVDASNAIVMFGSNEKMSGYCEGKEYAYERAINLLKEAIQ